MPGFSLNGPTDSRLYGLKVGDMIDPSTRTWDVNKLNYLFDVDQVKAILQIPIVRFGGVDKLIWSSSSDGRISMKTSYFHARQLLGKCCSSTAQRSHV